MVHIVDSGICNHGSMRNMLARLGIECTVANTGAALAGARRVILPGVGAFDAGMRNLEERGFVEVLRQLAAGGVPVLGVCLGMQLLTRGSEEGTRPGLSLIPAVTLRLRQSGEVPLRLPHMGWNTIRLRQACPLLADLPSQPRFYFVHSYGVQCDHEQDVLATCEYGQEFACAVGHGNVAGTQFHPEKSHRFGMQVLRNFATS
jgi:imidazole glycerol-phosphate synthase subunit HisH